jgi:hypothetical protein
LWGGWFGGYAAARLEELPLSSMVNEPSSFPPDGSLQAAREKTSNKQMKKSKEAGFLGVFK